MPSARDAPVNTSRSWSVRAQAHGNGSTRITAAEGHDKVVIQVIVSAALAKRVYTVVDEEAGRNSAFRQWLEEGENAESTGPPVEAGTAFHEAGDQGAGYDGCGQGSGARPARSSFLGDRDDHTERDRELLAGRVT